MDFIKGNEQVKIDPSGIDIFWEQVILLLKVKEKLALEQIIHNIHFK